jgi:hypothetical protein
VEEGGGVDGVVDARRASVVAFYGGLPQPLAELVGWVQRAATRTLGPAFAARPPDTVHATVIGLETPSPGWADDDRSRFDARPLASHLVHVFTDGPLELQFGGVPVDDLRWPSRGVPRYQRTFLAGPSDVVLIGWPVRSVGIERVPLPVLAEVRRACEAFGARHRYHAAPTDADADAYLVLGSLSRPPGPAAARLAEDIRRSLAAAPRFVRLGPEQLSLVEYAESTLPLDSTRRRPLIGF